MNNAAKHQSRKTFTDDKSPHKPFCFAAVQQFVHFKMSTFPKFYIKCFKKKIWLFYFAVHTFTTTT